MTAEEFRARYALLDQVAGGGVRTFHAVTPTAGVAMVHFVDGGITPYNLALLGALERLEPERRARVREVTAVDGSITVVTELLPDFLSLPAWLGLADAGPPSASPASATRDSAPPAHATADDAAGSAPPAGDPAGSTVPEESPFAAPSDPPSAGPADVAPAAGSALPARDADPAPSATGGADASRREPGEFTRLFLAADLTGAPAFSGPAPPPAAADAAPSPAAAPPPLTETEPAAATLPASTASPVPPAAAPATEPGDFTRLFRAPLAGDAAASSAAAPRTPDPVPASAPRAEEAAPAATAAAPGAAAEAPRPADPAPGSVPPAERRGRTDELASFRAVPLPPAGPPRAPAEPATPAFPAAPPAGTGTGGATGVFSAPGLGTGPAGDAPADAGGRGEFSQLFQRLDLPAWALPSQDRAASPPPAPPGAPEPLRLEHAPEPQAGDDYVDRLLSPSPRLGDGPPAESPAESAGSLRMPAFSAPPLPAGPPQPVASPSPAPDPAPAPAAADPIPAPAAGAPSPAPSTTPLLAGLILVVVLALALVAFFALR